MLGRAIVTTVESRTTMSWQVTRTARARPGRGRLPSRTGVRFGGCGESASSRGTVKSSVTFSHLLSGILCLVEAAAIQLESGHSIGGILRFHYTEDASALQPFLGMR